MADHPSCPNAQFNACLPLADGDSYRNALTWTAGAGTVLHYDEPTVAGIPTPGHHHQMAVHLGGVAPATTVATLDYAAADEGHACAVTVNGTTYHRNAATGALLTFTNGSVLLAL